MTAPSSASGIITIGDRYRIVGTLGVGARSAVFLGHDRITGAWRAVKVGGFSSDALVHGLFRKEARRLRRLSHRNVVRVHDAIEVGGRPTLVTELARGGSLADWVRRHGPLPAAWALEVADQCAAGLEHAHAVGIVHRSLRPGHVMFHSDGTAAITDFALWSATPTRSEWLLGGRHQAPELRDYGRPDARSDVYGLGATLYTAATGRIEDALWLCPECPSMLHGVDPGVAEVVRRCCRFDPADRVASMAEVRELLAGLARPIAPVSAPPLGGDGVPTPDLPRLHEGVGRLLEELTTECGFEDETTSPFTPPETTEDHHPRSSSNRGRHRRRPRTPHRPGGPGPRSAPAWRSSSCWGIG